jgi:A/G-specific adenine glycosylase
MNPAIFQQNVLAWFDQHGRKDLPWQQNISPYRVWLSEIMLQQTQVATVIPYFQAFIAKFPDVDSLAKAPVDEVLQMWSGLGYYARARNLHKAARIIGEQGQFPDTLDGLMALPGIGLSTAGAILSIAFNKGHPILDGNVKRVLARYKTVSGWTGNSQVIKQLWEISTRFTPDERVADYTQAMMDLGATVCTRSKPACQSCPLASSCLAWLTQTVADFPTRKMTKKLPVKQLIFLLLHNHQQQVLLEKRPSSGIWGGLWSLPEFASEDDAENWCILNNITIGHRKFSNQQRHTFSHYHLDYTPVFIETNSTMDYIQEDDRVIWHNIQQIKQLGLATPIKLLLQQHFKGE